MGALYQFVGHVARFVALGILLQEIRKEENLEYSENNEQLDDDDGPQRLAEAHGAEPVIVEVEDPMEKTVLIHRQIIKSWQIYKLYLKVPNVFAHFFVFRGR